MQEQNELFKVKNARCRMNGLDIRMHLAGE
jgi:hypothetical protein